MSRRINQPLTYEDYARLPSDRNRYELLAGVLHVTPAPSPLHQRVSKRLQRRLEAHFEARGLGEVFNAPIDVILTRQDVVQPDLVVVTDPAQVSARAIEGAPPLVVEVLSPATRRYDRTTKMTRLAELGVAHFWIVDPEDRRLECYRLESGRYRLVLRAGGDEVVEHPDFPGLLLTLGAIWP
ncbi:MAG: Uma2 family endonuclease [Candidatus Rokubacteria bacterium]|nr:Uma2 family endonuclease [Candidatus Rokubacteria bacterium]